MIADCFDLFLLDLDGVVMLGDAPLPEAVPSLHHLREMGKLLRFLTNDPRPTRDQVVDKLWAMGIEARRDEVVTSGWATATFLSQRQVRSAYVVGSAGLCAELADAGVALVEQGDPEVVVIGCDEQVSYRHLQQAARFLAQGAQFIATNADTWFPLPEGPSPATGAIVEAVHAVSGRRPLIIGKPFPPMFQVALRGLAPSVRMVMVGDNPATDILGAHQQGMTALLISHTQPHFPSPRDFRMPDAVLPSLAHLFMQAPLPRRWTLPAFAWPERVEAGVAAVIFDHAGRVLLGKRADNELWGLPSGHIECGETIEEAVIREVSEETGLQVAVVQLIGLYSDPVSQVFSYPTGEIIQFVTACFACEVLGGLLQCDQTEVLNVAFFDVHSLPHDLLPMHPRWLADALIQSPHPFVR